MTGRLGFHLMMCRACADVDKQMKFLRRAIGKMKCSLSSVDVALSPDARAGQRASDDRTASIC